MVSPFVLGNNQDQPSYYIGPYNFPEVTSYVGILALIAACTLLVRRWRKRTEARSWWVWYVVLAIGIVSALGAQTPFGHLLFLIPFVKDERLLNRNILLVDFSLAMLFAWWVHLLLAERAGKGRGPRVSLRTRWRPGGRAELVATCAPFAVALVLCAWAWLGGSLLERALGAQFVPSSATRMAVAGIMTGGVLIAGCATWIVLHAERFAARELRRLLAVVLTAGPDRLQRVGAPPTGQPHPGPGARSHGHRVHPPGRRRTLPHLRPRPIRRRPAPRARPDRPQHLQLGLPSGQGYAALTDGDYYDATGAHYQEDLAPASLAETTWDDLNVSTLLSLPGYFMTPEGSVPADSPVSFPVAPSVYNDAPAAKTGPVTLPTGRSHLWYFGSLLTLTSWSFDVPSGAAGGLQVGLVASSGSVSWLPRAAARIGPSGVVTVSSAGPVRAAGVVVANRGTGTAVVSIPTARTSETGAVSLDGPLQYGVDGIHWVYAGTFGSFGVFRNTSARGWAWATAPSQDASVRAGPPERDGGQQITVRATSPVTLDRSVAYASGWGASVQPMAGGSAHGVPVLQSGVVQQVQLPAGDYLVTFSYAPLTASIGIALSAVTALTLAVGAVLGWRVRRRRAPPSRTESASRGP